MEMIRRLQWELDRFELYVGRPPERIVVALDVRNAYLEELVSRDSHRVWLAQHEGDGQVRLQFNGRPLEMDPQLPVGAVVLGPPLAMLLPKRASGVAIRNLQGDLEVMDNPQIQERAQALYEAVVERWDKLTPGQTVDIIARHLGRIWCTCACHG